MALRPIENRPDMATHYKRLRRTPVRCEWGEHMGFLTENPLFVTCPDCRSFEEWRWDAERAGAEVDPVLV